MVDPSIPWWKKTVVYQIYPRSFQDTMGNGIGDLRGIVDRIDYLRDLGVETLWISPFYCSPSENCYGEHDCGYDITDYREINPEYGTMEIFEELIKKSHEMGLKIIMDMVLNHTSKEHPWFKESRSSRYNPKRDWYIWRDGKKPNGKKPPNNWRSIGGSAWEYDPKTDQWYYHAFLPFQPDLNYRNPRVRKEMLDIIHFWLEKGVDGFRLDIINALFEDPLFRDSPITYKLFSEDLDLFFRSSQMTLNHGDTIKFCKTLRKTIDKFPGKFLVGEISASIKTLRKYLGNVTRDGKNNDGLNLVFLFKSMNVPLKASSIKKLISSYETHFPVPFLPTWVFSNHDTYRRISKLGNNKMKAKLNMALQLTTRGVPFIYYGEEIGIEQARFHKRESKDALSIFYNIIPQFLRNILWRTGRSLNRDECRTPMQWNGSKNAGFSPPNVEPWLPVNYSHNINNVEKELKEADSLLNCYKRFLKTRARTPALNSGSFTFKKVENSPKSLLAYERSFINKQATEKAHVYLNFSSNTLKFQNPTPNLRLLVSTSTKIRPLNQDNIILGPWEGIVLIER